MASVLSTVLSLLNAFLDTELEQILCFDSGMDAEMFCNKKSAIFIVLPEEDQTKYFMVSLFLQQFYWDMRNTASPKGGGGGVGVRYHCRIKGKERYLWLDEDR